MSFVAGLCFLAAQNLPAGEGPRGNLIELHSCEVYAGGCTVSSQAPQGGRYMLQMWDIASGSWQGADLAGLKAAVVYASTDNLAEAGTRAGKAVVYLPESAKPAQREALLAWLKSRQEALKTGKVDTRIVSLTLQKTDTGVTFAAGDFACLETASLEQCEVGGCGEDLWYAPRTETSAFTVAVNAGSRVAEPLLSLKWSDNGSRSVFVGRFGEPTATKNLFVQSTDWCGPTGRLF